MDLFKLVGSIFINNSNANKDIDETTGKASGMAKTIGSALQSAGSKISKVGKAIAPVSTAMAGALGASVKGAANFQDSIAKVSTLVDTSKVSVSDLSKTFLDLSNETGKSASELAEAGYQALSASVPVEKLGQFTKEATNLAKVGYTDAATAVDVMTTAINAYGLSADDANKISNNLVKTQNLGKTTVDELSSSMGKIIPTASSMNVNLDNLSGVYVSLTKQGIATAEATTYANSMFNEMGDSGTTVGKILKEKTGKSFQDLMADGNSVADVLAILQDYSKETGTNFNELWSSSEAGKSAIAILNGGVDEFNSTVETMADSTDVVAEGLEKLNTPSAKAKKALNQIKNSGIELGSSFISALTPTIDKVASGVEELTQWFSGLSDGTKTMIATVMSIIAAASPVLLVGGKIISIIGSLITGIGSVITTVTTVISFVTGAIIPAIGTVVAAIGIIPITIAAVIAVIILLWNKCEWFRNGVNTCFNAIKTAVISTWNGIKKSTTTILKSLKSYVTSIWNGIKTVINSVLKRIKNIVKTVWNGIKTIITTVLKAIKSVVTSVLNAIKSVIKTILNAIKSKFSSIWNGIKATVSSAIKGIKSVISSGLNGAKSTVTNVLNSIKSKFTSIWNTCKTIVSNAIKKIKSAMKFSWSLPKLKLPHISISGKFSLKPPSAPKFDISWYRKAMDNPLMFTQPTLFDVNPVTGQARGAGEAGDEIMIGKNTMLNMIQTAVANQNGSIIECLENLFYKLFTILDQYFPEFSRDIILDDGTLVSRLAPKMDDEFGRIKDHKERGN
jgi:TP901 family phage tail tape measure protein